MVIFKKEKKKKKKTRTRQEGVGAPGLAGRRGPAAPQVLVPAPAGLGGPELQHMLAFYFLSVLYSLLVSRVCFSRKSV